VEDDDRRHGEERHAGERLERPQLDPQFLGEERTHGGDEADGRRGHL
jgi:hypothetical protein